jgi:hypothetical protein
MNTLTYTDICPIDPFALSLFRSSGLAARRIENSELPAKIQADEARKARLTKEGLTHLDLDDPE